MHKSHNVRFVDSIEHCVFLFNSSNLLLLLFCFLADMKNNATRKSSISKRYKEKKQLITEDKRYKSPIKQKKLEIYIIFTFSILRK